MSAIAISQLNTMAADAGSVAAPTVLLKQALDINESAMAQLLQGLPQKEGTGSIVDVQA